MICTCRCHATETASAFAHAGVDTRNAIEAVIACKACENSHVDALLETAIWGERVVPQRGVTVISPEGKQMSWEEYQRELEKRANTWRDAGEGPEA